MTDALDAEIPSSSCWVESRMRRKVHVRFGGEFTPAGGKVGPKTQELVWDVVLEWMLPGPSTQTPRLSRASNAVTSG